RSTIADRAATDGPPGESYHGRTEISDSGTPKRLHARHQRQILTFRASSAGPPPMTRRNALLAVHFGALMFGLSGVFGKLAVSDPLTITFGRALFAVLALLLAAQLLPRSGARPSVRQRAGLVLGALLLGGHWLTFFVAVKVAGVGIATLGFASFPAFTL